MNELSGRLLLAGRLVPGRVHFDQGRIVSVETLGNERRVTEMPVIAPGLVDLHVHGFGGFDPLEELPQMAAALARAGTTSFQPTLFPAAPAELGVLAHRTWERAQELAASAGAGANVLGLHLEGPFVNPRRAGALPSSALCSPSREGLRAILGPAMGSDRGIRTMTLAPELPGAADLITELARAGVRVSLGHSLATAAEARAAAGAGATGATHLFNAMGPVHHREVGLAGFALTDAALHAEIIGDLVHVGADAVRLALGARGPRGLCLVSDALPGAGTGCDVFHWHGQEHRVVGGAVYLAAVDDPRELDRERLLAGSALSQLEMVRKLVGAGVISLEEALAMASETPARALGLERELGQLIPGARADLIALDPKTLELLEVLVQGRPALASTRPRIETQA
jgi:N-acetylglucosamine-6-phosphate deacetylase